MPYGHRSQSVAQPKSPPHRAAIPGLPLREEGHRPGSLKSQLLRLDGISGRPGEEVSGSNRRRLSRYWARDSHGAWAAGSARWGLVESRTPMTSTSSSSVLPSCDRRPVVGSPAAAVRTCGSCHADSAWEALSLPLTPQNGLPLQTLSLQCRAISSVRLDHTSGRVHAGSCGAWRTLTAHRRPHPQR
jgi:hypothetical protein